MARSLAWGTRLPSRGNLLWCKPLATSHTQGDGVPGRPFFGRCALPVEAARKGDGKTKKPKQSAAKAAEAPKEAAPAAAAPAGRTAPRVVPNSLVPVRVQQMYAKLNKEIQRRSTQPPLAPTRSFRLPTKTEEEYKEEKRRKEEEALQLSKRESKSFALSQIHGSKNDPRQRTVLLVDGYNVIGDRRGKEGEGSGSGSDGEPGSLLLEGEELWEQRDDLIERLGSYSQQVGVRVVCAFDAMGGGSGVLTEELQPNGVTVVYCGDREADSYLSYAVDVYLEKGYKLVALVTNDQLIRLGNEWREQHHKKFGKQTVHCVTVKRLKNDMAAAARKFWRTVEENNGRLRTEMAPSTAPAGAGYYSKLSQLHTQLVFKQRQDLERQQREARQQQAAKQKARALAVAAQQQEQQQEQSEGLQ